MSSRNANDMFEPFNISYSNLSNNNARKIPPATLSWKRTFKWSNKSSTEHYCSLYLTAIMDSQNSLRMHYKFNYYKLLVWTDRKTSQELFHERSNEKKAISNKSTILTTIHQEYLYHNIKNSAKYLNYCSLKSDWFPFNRNKLNIWRHVIYTQCK